MGPTARCEAAGMQCGTGMDAKSRLQARPVTQGQLSGEVTGYWVNIASYRINSPPSPCFCPCSG